MSTPPVSDTLPVVKAKTARLKYVDAVRGLCIVSMLTLHVSETSPITSATHPFVVVDGAHGFVILAGYVLGLVERRRVARGDPLPVTRRAAGRRLVLLAVGHWVVALLVVFGNAVLHKHSLVTPGFARSSLGNQLWRTLTFRTMPDNIDILPMYLIFIFLGGFLWAPLLRRQRTSWVLAISLTMYVISLAGNGLPWLLTPFAALAWQALFTVGMVTGWHADATQQLRRRTHPASFIVCVSLPILCGLLARDAVRSRLHGDLARFVDWNINKFHLGPLNLLAGLGLVVAAAVIVGGIEKRGHLRLPMDWLALLGRRSLASYLAISVLAWLSHAIPVRFQEGLNREALIAGALVVTTLVAVARDRYSPRGRRAVPIAT